MPVWFWKRLHSGVGLNNRQYEISWYTLNKTIMLRHKSRAEDFGFEASADATIGMHGSLKMA
jgi:hypothetical protein